MVLHNHLREHAIPHRVISGHLRRLDGNGPKLWHITPSFTVPASGEIMHVWIALADRHLLDLRARMWFGEDAPHGVFDPADFPNFEYVIANSTA